MALKLTEAKRNEDHIPVKLAAIGDVPAREKEIHELIARQAYAIYEGRGHVHGSDIEDWLQAESEVLATLCVGFTELNGDLKVDIGIRASELPQLQVHIEPLRLIISGKKKAPARLLHQRPPDAGQRAIEIFQIIDFPMQVEPLGAKAAFWKGLLEIRIPKAAKTKTFGAAKVA
ncbi:MAG TPA: DUF2934 domain-containing protein [Terriglobia bacterium]|nr:DUF2934 domain-containing protein [Terriglobia bacterium]